MQSNGKMPYWLILCLIFLLCLVISVSCIQVGLVEGHSMEPSYHSGQLVLISKMSDEYCAGDVVLFYCDGLRSFLIKRIVACPGDTLIINDGQLYVNSERIPGYSGIGFAGTAEHELVMAEDSFFLLGDNLSESVDSRDDRVGPVDLSDIRGKVIQR